jgi:hypothetical protein
MNVASLLDPELLAVSQAAGLVRGDGELDASWFENPLTKLERALTDPTQRTALFTFFDQVLPPDPISEAPANEKWHPLLGSQTHGNVYLTVTEADPAIVGIAGLFGKTSGTPSATLRARLPVASLSGSSFTAVAGTSAGPLTLSLNVALGWTMPAQPIALAGIAVDTVFATNPPTATIAITLQGLDLDGKGAHDTPLDPRQLGPEATTLLVGLIRNELTKLSSGASDEAKAVANHLMPLLGLDGVLPPFPFATITQNSHAIRQWLNTLATGPTSYLQSWLGHLAGILGVAAPTVNMQTSAGATSWSVPIAQPNSASTVNVTLTKSTAADGVTPLLSLGAGVVFSSTAPGPARLDASATLVALPLAGTIAPSVFPSAELVVAAPSNAGTPMIPASPGAAISLDSLRAGISWNGATVVPLLEMRNVVISGAGTYPLIDLTNANTVVAAASAAASAALAAALGTTGPGVHLAALVGLVHPNGDTSAPLIDPAQLVTRPTTAIAALHRGALVSTTHTWQNYFAELVALLSLPGSITGNGTAAQPWAATITNAGALALELAAWNAQTSGNASDPQQLRIGLRLTVSSAAMTASWSSELLAVDMPATGANAFALLGGHHACVTITPPQAVTTATGISVAATALQGTFDYVPGSPTRAAAVVTGLTLTTPAGTVSVPTLSYPPAVAFDVSNPTASLGVAVGSFEHLIVNLAATALSGAFGVTGMALSALLGFGAGVPGLQTDFPTLTDPGAPGSLFTDPLGALRAWANQVATGVSSTGTDFTTPLAAWLASLLANDLPSSIILPPDFTSVAGSGTYDDPWQLPLGAGTSTAAGLVWFEPAGPALAATGASEAVTAANDFGSLVDEIAWVGRYLPALPTGLTSADLASGLQSLGAHLTSTDGVVPVTSQLPTGGTWTQGTAIGAPHHLQPSDASACAQIIAQVDAWAAYGSNRAILLLGPAFSDHTTWSTLLAQAEAAHAGVTNTAATFNLRVPGADPASVDLRPVTAIADYYTADLQDDGSSNTTALVTQIGLVLARIAALKPGASVILVAHSTAGLAARAYTAAHSTAIKGLITLGTPHAGAPLTPLRDPATAEALRAINHLLPSGVAAGPLHDALGHLTQALDGYLPGASGALPTPWPYPVGAFTATGATDTGGVPALALGGQLDGSPGVDLLGGLRTAASTAIGAVTAAAPTHLGFGVRTALTSGGHTDVTANGSVRLDVGRVALRTGVSEPSRPAHALTASASLSRAGGWLAGGPLSYTGPSNPLVNVRVRSAELGLVVTSNGSTLSATPTAQLHDAAYHGATVDLLSWGDAQLEASLGSIFQSIAATPPAAGTSLASMLDALTAFGIAAPTAQGGIGLAVDAVHALSIDPIGYLTPKVTTAFAPPGLLGFTAAGESTYVLPLGGLPLEAVVQVSPPAVGLRTTVSGPGLALGSSTKLAFSALLPLKSMTPAVSGSLGVGHLSLSYASGALSVQVPPTVPSLQLYPPPSSAALLAACNAAVPALLISGVAEPLVSSFLSPGYQLKNLVTFLNAPGAWLESAAALGTSGGALDPAKINTLLGQLPPLPGGLTINASGSNPTTIVLATGTPLAGMVSLALGAAIDAACHVTPAGTVTLQTSLGGSWPSIAVAFGVNASGVTLTVTPGGGTPIQLLPTFSGAAALTGAAEMLLPHALDALLNAVAPNPMARPAIVTLALDVASALDLWDSTGGFGAHTTQLAALTSGSWTGSVASSVRTQVINAIGQYFNDTTSPLRGVLPGSISASAGTITWMYPATPTPGTMSVALAAGWDGGGPTLTFGIPQSTITGSPVAISLAAGYASGSLALDATLGLDLSSSVGIAVIPQLVVGLAGGAFTATILPLGAGTASELAVHLAPSPGVTVNGSAATTLVEQWAIPLVAKLVLDAAGAGLDTHLWSSGPTIRTVLVNANVITGGGALKTPLAPLDTMLANLLGALTPATIPLASDPALALTFTKDPMNSNALGVGLLGELPLNPGSSPEFSVLFGKPADWLGPSAGVSLDLFTTQGGLNFAPALHVRGLGVGLSGGGTAPLINTSGFRLGAVDGYLAFELTLLDGHVTNLGGGVEIDKLGLPLGLAGSGTTNNPVAASMVRGDGGTTGGDNAPVNPSVDVIAYYLDSAFKVQFGGLDQPIVIPVHASFGPMYLDQIDISTDQKTYVEVGLDGSVSIAGLTVALDELALQVPFKQVLEPEHWTLDLQGLSVGFSEGPIEIAGGLRKNPGPPVEYDGMLSVTVEELGLTVVAAYSQPSDAQGAYTSLFMFVSLGDPLGGPPFAFIIGLGGGFGYNRELIVPTDMNKIDSFLLVQAIDDGSLANDPMTALMSMGQAMPARRGSFWIAAGVRLTTFALINSTVVVVVSFDRGFEIDVLGISRMALPDESTALVSVELALKARFNSEEGVLSVQAQLTDNSYLFSRDCQLTGGFAFFAWFHQGQFVLTLGGYNPVFVKPSQFPDVPRLGFHWSIGDYIVIKGGCYFALTNSCVMAGGALSATASIGPVSAWFDAHLDFLISWDPFHYEFDIGVEIGASLSVTICFFGCVTIGITISVGADLTIEGPPFHGTASIDAYVTTITIEFGDPPQPPPYITDWNVFAGKYLTAGDANFSAVSTQFKKGLLPPDPPGGQPQPGTQDHPWQVGVEFSFITTTRMPTSSASDWVFGTEPAPAGVNALDVAPMDQLNVGSTHALTLEQQQTDGSWKSAPKEDASDHWTIAPTTGFFPEATWHWTDPAHIPAAARTISAINGISVDAHVALYNQTQLIPIATLVADNINLALPLPFDTTPVVAPQLQGYGASAEALAAAVASAPSQQTLAASESIVSGGTGVFAQNRAAAGLPAQGLSPLAGAALRRTRSSPPLLTPLSTGLTMKPVGIALPAAVATIAPVTSVALEQPRLRATMAAAPAPTIDAPPALHTSVTQVVSALDTATGTRIPRMRPPTPDAVAGAHLIRVPAADAARPTRAATGARALRNAEFGAATPPAHQQALDQAASDLSGTGVTLGAGATHIWDLPNDRGTFTLAGTGGARLIITDRGGATLSDFERVPAGAPQRLPTGAAMAIIENLGTPPAGAPVVAAGFGALSLLYCSPGNAPVVGWQSGTMLRQIGPTRFAARGATLRLPRAYATRTGGQRASYGVTRAADAIRGQVGVETELPNGVDVVIITLDLADASAASQGDLAIGAVGATLSTPQRVAARDRRILIYDVGARDPKATSLTISVVSAAGWSVAGVMGARGTAVEWATRLRAGIPDHFVPEGPVSPSGSLTVTYTPGG